MKRVLAAVILAGASELIRRRRRPCPTCRGGGVNWSESSFGQYGLACLRHRLFWVYYADAWHPIPLSQAHIPSAYRSVPAFRGAAGWTGPTS